MLKQLYAHSVYPLHSEVANTPQYATNSCTMHLHSPIDSASVPTYCSIHMVNSMTQDPPSQCYQKTEIDVEAVADVF